jgi:hypothetical protein
MWPLTIRSRVYRHHAFTDAFAKNIAAFVKERTVMKISDARTLREIAGDIEDDWLNINNGGARNALDCMKTMGAIEAPYFYDRNGYAVVVSFLGNAHGWRGPVARRVKKELRTMCGHPRP